ncbi:hypothetical protein CRG98_041834 [Punica granatum]|uniref:Uncharacterized protein n=1 Tax=Punica granatum TaxID=22663 RepID=A0A2I0I1S7_PUNGR|nr:hypothetical protein CRG98_041834 [Punica granatum]
MTSHHPMLLPSLMTPRRAVPPPDTAHHPPCTSALHAHPIPPPFHRPIRAAHLPRNQSTRKRKLEMPYEEFIKRAAPYTAILNKMPKTLGEAMHEDPTFPGHQPFQGNYIVSLWQCHNQPYFVEEMEDGELPVDIQMAEEAGPNMPPSYP